MVTKQLLHPDRKRHIPKQFSWVDQELIRGGYGKRCSAEALGLYLFLITVGDSDGLSYYSDHSISNELSLDAERLVSLRAELIRASLIAYKKPLYQVLSLGRLPQPVTGLPRGGEPQTVSDILRSITARRP